MEVGVFLWGIAGIQTRDTKIWAAFLKGEEMVHKPKYIYKVE